MSEYCDHHIRMDLACAKCGRAGYSDIRSDGGMDPRAKYEAERRAPTEQGFKCPHCAQRIPGVIYAAAATRAPEGRAIIEAELLRIAHDFDGSEASVSDLFETLRAYQSATRPKASEQEAGK